MIVTEPMFRICFDILSYFPHHVSILIPTVQLSIYMLQFLTGTIYPCIDTCSYVLRFYVLYSTGFFLPSWTHLGVNRPFFSPTPFFICCIYLDTTDDSVIFHPMAQYVSLLVLTIDNIPNFLRLHTTAFRSFRVALERAPCVSIFFFFFVMSRNSFTLLVEESENFDVSGNETGNFFFFRFKSWIFYRLWLHAIVLFYRSSSRPAHTLWHFLRAISWVETVSRVFWIYSGSCAIFKYLLRSHWRCAFCFVLLPHLIMRASLFSAYLCFCVTRF